MASFLSTRAKKFRKRMLSELFYLCRKAQHHLTEGQHHFSQSENIIVRLRTQNDVALRANDVLRNDVMLRINDVALRANGFFTSVLKNAPKCDIIHLTRASNDRKAVGI